MARDTVPASSTHEGPTREGELVIERRGIEPVPPNGRYGRVSRVFTVWFAPQISPPPFFIGALVAALGLSFSQGVFALVVANIVGTAPVAALATWGPKTGMAQMPLSRLAFGKSIMVPGVVNWATTIGWQAFNNVFGATALNLLFHVPFWIALLLIFAGQAILSVAGYEAVHIFEKWMTYVLGVVFLYLMIKILTGAGTTALPSTLKGADLIGMMVLMIAIAGSYVYGWAPYAADYSRYLPENTSKSAVFWNTFLGIGVASLWMELLGLAVAGKVLAGGTLGTSATIRDLMGPTVLGWIGLVAIYLGTVAVNAVNDYTGSLSLQAAGVRLARPVAAGLTGLASFGLSLWFLYGSESLPNKAENFLLFLVYWISAWLGVVTVDWIRRKGRVNVTAISDFSRLPAGIPALVAFVLGFAASIPFSNTTAGYNFVVSHPGWRYLIGWFPANPLHQADLGFVVGFVVSAVVYAALSRREAESELAGMETSLA